MSSTADQNEIIKLHYQCSIKTIYLNQSCFTILSKRSILIKVVLPDRRDVGRGRGRCSLPGERPRTSGLASSSSRKRRSKNTEKLLPKKNQLFCLNITMFKNANVIRILISPVKSRDSHQIFP